MTQKMTRLALALAAACVGSMAFAQAKAPEPAYTLGFNVGANSDYRYRGISQSRLSPAISGGLDFSHKNGFYLGTWASTIKWIKDGGGDASLELDLYGGYKGSAGSIGYDIGLLHYHYPSHKLAVSPNTTEIYGALSFGPVTAKYSHSTSNLFGFDKSKGSGYFDLSASFDLGGGWTVAPHIGRQGVAKNSAFSYTDYSLTATKDLGNGLALSAALVGTDTKEYVSPKGKNLGKNAIVLGAKYSF